jgi:uncharacterized repeat protein (TIGR04138 family)
MDENPYQAPKSNLDESRDESRDERPEHDPSLPHFEYDPTGVLFAAAAERSGLDIGALRFVFDAKFNAWDFALDTPQQRLHGPDLCRCVVRYAEELYGRDALRILENSGLASGADVSRALAALVQSELLKAENEEMQQDLGSVGPLRQFAEGG